MKLFIISGIAFVALSMFGAYVSYREHNDLQQCNATIIALDDLLKGNKGTEFKYGTGTESVLWWMVQQ